VQAAVIASVVVKEQRSPSGPELASAPNKGSYAVVRFAPQATANDITKFLRALRAARWHAERLLTLLKQVADAVATTREDHRSPRSGPAVPRRRWRRAPIFC
jgi:PAS domain-containing protein